jgi:hypothetical protein
MDSEHITAMVRALEPALKSRQRALAILQAYWKERMALIWTSQQVHRAANEVGVALTKSEAQQVLQTLHRMHNRQYGLRWSDLTDYIKENALGRKLTKAELKGFIEKDRITIHKQRRKKT